MIFGPGCCGVRAFGVAGELPALIRVKVAELPEFRMGVHRVGVRLASGAWWDDVLVFRWPGDTGSCRANQ